MKRLRKKRMNDASFSVLASIGGGGGEGRGRGEIYGKMDEWMNGSPFEIFPWNNSLTCGRDEILLEVFGFLAINNLLNYFKNPCRSAKKFLVFLCGINIFEKKIVSEYPYFKIHYSPLQRALEHQSNKTKVRNVGLICALSMLQNY